MVSGPHPLKNHKNIEFLSNSGPDLLNNHKAAKPKINIRPSSNTWRADDGPLLVLFRSSLPSYKNVVRVGPHLTKLSGAAHGIKTCL